MWRDLQMSSMAQSDWVGGHAAQGVHAAMGALPLLPTKLLVGEGHERGGSTNKLVGSALPSLAEAWFVQSVGNDASCAGGSHDLEAECCYEGRVSNTSADAVLELQSVCTRSTPR